MSVTIGAIGTAAACLFVGDSTALGAAAAFNRIALDPCTVVARLGISSAAVAALPLPARPVSFAIFGIGSNDPTSLRLAANLWRRRSTIRATRVVWLLPYDRRAAATVERVAALRHDYVLDLAELATRDALHPANYHGIAIALRRLGVGSPVPPPSIYNY